MGVPAATFIAGRARVLDEFIATAASARSRVHLETFKLAGTQARQLRDVIDHGADLRVMTSRHADAQREIAVLTRPFGDRAGVTSYGRTKLHVDKQFDDVFSHAKAAVADYERATFSTAALENGGMTRLDWGLTVTGPQAKVAGKVLDVAERGAGAQRLAMADAARAGVYYNDRLVGVQHATDAWMGAIGSAHAGERALVVTKRLTSTDAARVLAAAHQRGVNVEVIAGRTKPRAVSILQKAGVPVSTNVWPGPSLHGNLTVVGDQLLLGSMYLSKRPLGLATHSASRELMISTRDPAAVTDAVRAIREIRVQPLTSKRTG